MLSVRRSKSRAAGRVRAISAGSAMLALAGCASQGPLRPPSLHLPAQVRGLVAKRAGNAVDLQWSNPTRTTDGMPLHGRHIPQPIQVDICREESPRSACIPLGRVPLGPDAAGAFRDVLPATLAAGFPRLLRYRVQTVNGDGRGTATAAVEALAGLAPAPLEDVQAAPADSGVLIRWKPTAGTASGRIVLHVTRGEPAGTNDRDTLLAIEAMPGSPAGTLDPGAKPGVAQQYTLAREQTVHLREGDFRMTSTPILVSVGAEAKQPPLQPPAGLQAVVNTLAAPEIDLVWQPVAAATGYLIFRAELPGAPVLLTSEPVRGLSYNDTAVRPGGRYQYSVSATGRDGAAGLRSSPMEEHIPAN